MIMEKPGLPAGWVRPGETRESEALSNDHGTVMGHGRSHGTLSPLRTWSAICNSA